MSKLKDTLMHYEATNSQLQANLDTIEKIENEKQQKLKEVSKSI